MAGIKERTQRKYQVISDPDKIEHMLKTYMLNRKFFIKGEFEMIPVAFEKIIDKDRAIVYCAIDLDESVTLYRVFKKYMDAVCIIEDRLPENRYKIHISQLRIAESERKNDRVIAPAGSVVVNNIRAARNVIKASLFNVPTSVKVHLSEYEKRLQGMADEVKVSVFDKSDDKLELVRKSGKILWVENSQDLMSYMPPDLEAFIDYREYLNTEIGAVMEGYRHRKIISEMIVPVIYVGHDGLSIPLGYIQLVSKSEPIGMDKAMELKALTFEMVDRIRDSNTMMINKRQEITNLSKGGLQIRIVDEELKTFLIHQKGFSFDVIFKLQQPITVFTEIIYTGFNQETDLMIGVRIVGWSSRKGEVERYTEAISSLAKGKI
ncbi:MAG: DUF1577 domain-containing protein [Leptospiraceae bacterium]|nr:DUF1577 domain-containing protein [Leptospiraceae bacterium]